MTAVKNNRIVKYIVTWKSTSNKRKEVRFDEHELAESFYQIKLERNKSPSLYVTELVESTRQLK
jgi:hypothetical protein